MPQGFVYVKDYIPSIAVELRYYGENNFVGTVIDGYEKPRCILSESATLALKKVQDELQPFGLGLKIYDAYRPKRAVNHFVRWAKNRKDTKMKAQYYPTIAKSSLFKSGYIASKSGHSRGSTIDLTLISLDETHPDINMGTAWDTFSRKSWVNSQAITISQHTYRMLLQTVMKKQGFKPYKREWWHFTLKNEPFRNQYFDFVVR